MATATERPYSNNGLLIGTGAAAPPRSMRALLTGEVPVGSTGYPPVPVRVAFPVAAWGAVGDGMTDDTTAINGAISAASAAGGGVVTFGPGTYMASQIVLQRYVLLDGGHAAAVELKQIGGSNRDFIISENFAALTGTGHTVGTSALVPSWFGLKDIRIDGNGLLYGTNTAGRGIAWYGNAQIMKGVVRVHDTAGDAIYTENSNSSAGEPWQADESSFFDNVIVQVSGGHGWLFRGPHNARINSYYCVLYTGTGYGWKNETTANTSGVVDEIGILHVYSNGPTKTGIYIDAGLVASEVTADGCSVVINATAEISTLAAFAVDAVTMPGTVITVSGGNVAVGTALIGTVGAVDNTVCLLWSGGSGMLRSAYIYDGGGGANNIGLKNTGGGNQFSQVTVENFTGTGGIGIQEASGGNFTAYDGLLIRNKIGFTYDGGGATRARLDVFSGVGQAPVSGAGPTDHDSFDIRAHGAGAGKTATQIIAIGVIPLTATVAAAVSVAHGCLYTPTPRNVQVTFAVSTLVYDWAWDLPPMVRFVDAVNVDIVYKLRVASGTAGAVGSLIIAVRVGA